MTLAWSLGVRGAIVTDPGRAPDKQINEDTGVFRALPGGLHLALVCDGMGGHAGGQWASQTATTTIVAELERRFARVPLDAALRDAVRTANRVLVQACADRDATCRPGTTCVALLFEGHSVVVAHVGDSRAYRVRHGQLTPLTSDHTVVRELMERGLLTSEQMTGHPDAHQVTRALGIMVDVEPEILVLTDLEPADRFLLCSDGLSDLVSDAELSSALCGPESPDELARNLVALANARGGHDNVTALVAHVVALSESAPTQLLPEFGQSPTMIDDELGPATIRMPMPPGQEPASALGGPLPASPETKRARPGEWRGRVWLFALVLIAALTLIFLRQCRSHPPRTQTTGFPSASWSVTSRES